MVKKQANNSMTLAMTLADKTDEIHDQLRAAFKNRFRKANWNKFIDSFGYDIITPLVKEHEARYGAICSVVFYMYEAWEAGRDALKADIAKL